ncbi:hypothetical protein BCR33DRAFT_362068 [Rhizoclosmatium globosum]|uniref:Uncharacterized protein n=1 Tax=Rhizoclosmatium globosum TaxID=329046 RepID=A0A1Y2C006_9FUNG|nr:hypothetical protein BCR33DRAFT_362068 [Rhizoclosmatium globosum]|eukprot:ORY40341.1 hypothetical protein BCR33DRAFT_362068 [Rhizoclosmatium globosum]
MSSTTTGLGSYVDLLAGDSLGLTASSPITATVNAASSRVPFSFSFTRLIEKTTANNTRPTDKKNLPWKAYLESYLPAASPPNPTTCSPLISSTSPQGYTYSKSHNPFLVFKNITSDPTRCNLITNEQSFAFDVANNSMPTWGFYVLVWRIVGSGLRLSMLRFGCRVSWSRCL